MPTNLPNMSMWYDLPCSLIENTTIYTHICTLKYFTVTFSFFDQAGNKSIFSVTEMMYDTVKYIKLQASVHFSVFYY